MISSGQTPGFDLSELSLALLAGSLVLVVAVAAVRLANRAGLPTLLLYLAIGLALGQEGLGIPFDSEQMAQVLGYCALVLILVEGGLTTKWSSIRASSRRCSTPPISARRIWCSMSAAASAIRRPSWPGSRPS